MNKIETRQHLFDTMTINQNAIGRVEATVENMIKNRDRYAEVARHFSNKDLKWYVVACIHALEGELNFNTYLGNGQSIHKITTIVPKGRGPFKNFEEGAIDALKLQGANGVDMSSIGALLYFLEGYNGYGYEKYHQNDEEWVNSPYLWAGSNHYQRGKYTSDGKWNAKYVSDQIGVALLLKRLKDLSLCM